MKVARTALFYGLICLLTVSVAACRQKKTEETQDAEAQRAAVEARFAEYDAKAAKLTYEPIVTNDDGISVLKDVNFMEAVNEGGILVVDFWMDNCIPCEDMEPIVKGLVRHYEGRVRFAKLHYNTNEIMTEKYGVQAFPTFAFFVDGKPVGILEGMQGQERMRMVLDRILLDHHAKQDEAVLKN